VRAAGVVAGVAGGGLGVVRGYLNAFDAKTAALQALNGQIARNLLGAASGKSFVVVSRSDSTLRGHFPLETDALSEVLGPFDGVLLIPFFETGGRHTINDVHYLAEAQREATRPRN